jgi:hypothetical protein
MNNDELKHLLKSGAVPQRDENYWEEFPKTVTREMRRGGDATIANPAARQTWFSPAFIVGLATACIICAFGIKFWKGKESSPPVDQLASVQKYFREIEAMFPNQLQAIVFDESGPHLVLSENRDVPKSAPLFLKISDGNNSRRIVTFSGQQIAIKGQLYEVLSDKDGNILLVGENSVWTSNDAHPRTPYRVQATTLETL